MPKPKTSIVKAYAKMWPRVVFDIKDNGKLLKEIHDLLRQPGVYVLYRDDQPYYVGSAIRLIHRLHKHANVTKDRYYNFWNYFSAFVVPDSRHLREVEGILIASMPTENGAIHRIKKIHLPSKIARRIREERVIQLQSDKA